MIERKIKTKGHNDNLVMASYSGLSDVMATPIGEPNEINYERKKESEKDGGSASGKSWYGIADHNIDQCLDLFVNGWVDGVAKLGKYNKDFALDAPLSETTVSRPRQRYGDEGETIDIQAVLSGDLDHAWHGMERRTMDDLKTRINIVVNTGGHAGMDSDELRWPGILASALATRALENGYDVRITAAFKVAGVFESGDDSFISYVTLKSYDAPMSLANLAPLMLPAIFRAVGFRCMWNNTKSVTGSLGRPCDITKDEYAAVMGSELDDGTLLTIPRVKTLRDTKAAYKKLIKEVNS